MPEVKTGTRPIFLFLLLLISHFAQSQSLYEIGAPFIQNYSPRDYQAESQNWAIAQDKRGVMYFGNTEGILEFDGTSWRTIMVSNNTIARSLDVDKEGIIYVGAANEFGFLRPDKSGKLVYKSLKSKLKEAHQNFNNIWRVLATSHGVYYLSEFQVFRYYKDTVDVIPVSLYANFGYKAYDEVFLLHNDGGIHVLHKGELQLLPYSNHLKSSELGRIIILPYRDNQLMLATLAGIFIYDLNFLTNNFEIAQRFVNEDISDKIIYKLNSGAAEYIDQKNLYSGIRLDKNRVAFGTLQGGIIIMDNTGRVLRLIDKSRGLPTNSIYEMMVDRDGKFWAAGELGISYIDLDIDFTIFDDKSNLNGSVLSTIKHNGIRYAGTMSHINYLPAFDDVLHENANRFLPVKYGDIDTWAWDSVGNSLLAFTSYGAGHIFEDQVLRWYPLGDVYTTAASAAFPNGLFVGTTKGLLYFEKTNPQETNQLKVNFETKHIFDELDEPISRVVVDKSGNLWLTSYYNGLIYVKYNSDSINDYTIRRYGVGAGLPQADKNFIVPHNDDLLVATQQGVYMAVQQADSFVFRKHSKFRQFNKDSVAVNQLVSVDEKKVWFLSKTSIGYFERFDENSDYIVRDSVITRIPASIVHLLYHEDSVLWLTTSVGLYRYNISQKSLQSAKFDALIRRVEAGKDSVLFYGTAFPDSMSGQSRIPAEKTQCKALIPEICYAYNSLSFEFGATNYENPSGTRFSTRLIGYDNEWTDWNDKNERTFTNLYEGAYIFSVRAKNEHNMVSTVASYRFQIIAPWYRSIYAYLFYLLLFYLMLRAGIYVNSRRLKAANLRLEQIVSERTAEIHSQKEEIHSQAEQLELTNKELEKLSLVASETANAVIIMNASGDFEWVNEGFTRMYGYTLEECTLSDKRNIEYFTNNPNAKDAVRKCIEEEHTVIYEFLTKTKFDEKIWAQTTLTPIFDEYGELTKVIAIDTDISELKEAEAEIYQQKEEIESQRDELQRLNATKDKFFSIIAHDLRGPLGVVINSTGILYENYELFDVDEQHNMIGEIHKASIKTYNLLENLLNWSRSQRGEIKFNPEKVDLSLLIDENMELFRINAANKSIKMERIGNENIFAYADENMVSTILRNLISNAIKFSHTESNIIVEVSVNEEEHRISVTDYGVGIRPEQQDKLFRIDQHFTTLGTQKEKGTGLGLILSKEFVEKNGGKIRVASEFGKGATFSFSLPAYRSDSENQ